MNDFPDDALPRLARGCRLSTTKGHEDTLLIPEGALRLKGPARAVIELCDGKRNFGDIVRELQRRYPSEDSARIESDVASLLERLRDKRVIDVE